jgi:hypothetical protein
MVSLHRQVHARVDGVEQRGSTVSEASGGAGRPQAGHVGERGAVREHRTSYGENPGRDRGAGVVDRGLRAMAYGRIALGVGSVVAPAAMARVLGVRPSGELSYLTSVFGGRAIALGAAYLLGDEAERRRLRRLCLGVDVSDTVAGLGHLVRGDAPRPAMAAMVALTGSYAAIGAARLLADLRAPEPMP